MVYLGNKQGSKAYRLFDPTTRKICISRDVKFKKDETWDWSEYLDEHINDEPEWTDFRIENLEETNEHHDQENQPNEEDNDFPNNDDDGYDSPLTRSPIHSETLHTPSTRSSQINSQVTASTLTQSFNQSDNDSTSITNTHSHFDHTPIKGCRTLNDIYENTEELYWLKMNLRTTKKHQTKKIDRSNEAKGYIQEHGIEFEEVFAPVARMETICLLLAIAANNKWEVHHLDVKSAFLHGELKEEVYVTQPEGFTKKRNDEKVYRLIKALYGLRQAPRAWNIKLDNTLKSLDFKKCALEQAIYTKASNDSLLLVGVYVDDLIITGTPKKEIDRREAQDKLEAISEKCLFVGYPEESFGYLFYKPKYNMVFVARRGVFLEREMISKEDSGSKIDIEKFKKNKISDSTLTKFNEPANYKEAMASPEADKWIQKVLKIESILKDCASFKRPFMDLNRLLVARISAFMRKSHSLDFLEAKMSPVYMSKPMGVCNLLDDKLDKMSRVPYGSAIGSIMFAMTCKRPDVLFALSMTDSWFMVEKKELRVTSYYDVGWQTDKDDSQSHSGWMSFENGVNPLTLNPQPTPTSHYSQFLRGKDSPVQIIWTEFETLEMKGYFDMLESLNMVFNTELSINIILSGLPADYNQFVLSYEMNGKKTSIMELHSLLKIVEKGIKKSDKGKATQGKSDRGSKRKVEYEIAPTSDPKEAVRFYYNTKGHWKRSCLKYLKDLKNKKVKKGVHSATKDGKCYYITFTDEFSRYGYVYLIKHKLDTFEVFKRYQNKVENQLGRKLKLFQSDSGGEYISIEFFNHLKNCGIVSHLTPPRIPQLNGVAERRNKTLLDMEESFGYLFYKPKDNVVFIINTDTQQEVVTPIEPDDISLPIRKTSSRNLVDTTPGLKTVGCKWIFKKKTDMDGKVHTYKARLVAKGYTQTHKIDYKETFSPVAKIKSIRIMLVIAAFHDYEILQMDVKTAFLNEKLTEDVFMAQPEGFDNEKYPKRVYKLQKTINGLKQASRSWNLCFHEKVTQFGFFRSEYELCVYVKVSGSVVVFLVLYVKDILLIGNDILTLQSVKDWLGRCFAMKDLGGATYILGIKIYMDTAKHLIGLSQDMYLDKILKRFRIKNSKKGNLPLHHGIKISKDLCPKTDDELDKMSRVPYASAIGSIMYDMACKRPDVLLALSMVSRHQQNPSEGHWTAVKNILMYLRNTKDIFHVYGGEKELRVTGYCDTGWKTDKDNTCEASKEAIWMKNFIGVLRVVPIVQDPIEIFCDNESAVALTEEPKDHRKSKHIERKYHFVQSKVEEGHVIVKDIRSEDNPADPFTKALAKSKHDEHAKSIGLKDKIDF
uniref:Retrotransposon protein, putative, Ty1-copia subclass n=1 Tax=Tanacetum cinerariifolium TaxID=118510 RepID=A0A6L2JGH1_TANCI|nr:retrotransposon protein, putative, Ty1-copia subclass [Tanacetum cinerariifolium]